MNILFCAVYGKMINCLCFRTSAPFLRPIMTTMQKISLITCFFNYMHEERSKTFLVLLHRDDTVYNNFFIYEMEQSQTIWGNCFPNPSSKIQVSVLLLGTVICFLSDQCSHTSQSSVDEPPADRPIASATWSFTFSRYCLASHHQTMEFQFPIWQHDFIWNLHLNFSLNC